MTTKTQSGKSRQRYSQQYKSEALALAEQLGVAAAARQLGINENQLYNWRRRARLLQDKSAAEERLLVENARLKRQLAEQAEELAILKKAAAYFAKSQKEVRLYAEPFERIQDHECKPCAGRLSQWILPLPATGRTAYEAATTAHGS